MPKRTYDEATEQEPSSAPFPSPLTHPDEPPLKKQKTLAYRPTHQCLVLFNMLLEFACDHILKQIFASAIPVHALEGHFYSLVAGWEAVDDAEETYCAICEYWALSLRGMSTSMAVWMMTMLRKSMVRQFGEFVRRVEEAHGMIRQRKGLDRRLEEGELMGKP